MKGPPCRTLVADDEEGVQEVHWLWGPAGVVRRGVPLAEALHLHIPGRRAWGGWGGGEGWGGHFCGMGHGVEREETHLDSLEDPQALVPGRAIPQHCHPRTTMARGPSQPMPIVVQEGNKPTEKNVRRMCVWGHKQ